MWNTTKLVVHDPCTKYWLDIISCSACGDLTNLRWLITYHIEMCTVEHHQQSFVASLTTIKPSQFEVSGHQASQSLSLQHQLWKKLIWYIFKTDSWPFRVRHLEVLLLQPPANCLKIWAFATNPHWGSPLSLRIDSIMVARVVTFWPPVIFAQLHVQVVCYGTFQGSRKHADYDMTVAKVVFPRNQRRLWCSSTAMALSEAVGKQVKTSYKELEGWRAVGSPSQCRSPTAVDSPDIVELFSFFFHILQLSSLLFFPPLFLCRLFSCYPSLLA